MIGSGRSKYRAQMTTVEGIKFHSKKEASYYLALLLREQGGEVKDIVRQPPFPLRVNGVLVCTYKADFQFYDLVEERQRIIDVKGYITPIYRLKQKLMQALYPLVTIEEV